MILPAIIEFYNQKVNEKKYHKQLGYYNITLHEFIILIKGKTETFETIISGGVFIAFFDRIRRAVWLLPWLGVIIHLWEYVVTGL